MKKIIIVFISISLVFVFTGCKSDNTPQEETFESKYNSILDLSKHVTLKLCIMGVEDKFDTDVLQELNLKTNKMLNADIDIDVIEFDAEYMMGRRVIDEIKKRMNAGEVFDAFISKAMNYQSKIIADGAYNLLDITTMFPKYAPNLYLKYSDAELETCMYEGKQIILKDLFTVPKNRLFVLIRKDYAEEFGIEKINTFEEYEKYLDMIYEKEKRIINSKMHFCTPQDSIYRYIRGYSDFNAPGLSLAYKLDDPNRKVFPWEQTEYFKEDCRYYRKLVEKGYTTSANDYDMYSKSDGLISSYGLVNAIYTRYPEKYLIFMLYPEANYPSELEISEDHQGAILGFNKNAENPERFLCFLDWAFTDNEINNLLVYGILDNDYSINDTGKIVFSEPTFEEPDCYYSKWTGTGSAGMKFFKNPEFLKETISQPDNYYNDLYTIIDKTTIDFPDKGFDAVSVSKANSTIYNLIIDRGNILNFTQESMLSKLKYDDEFDFSLMTEAIEESNKISSPIVNYFQSEFDKWRDKNEK